MNKKSPQQVIGVVLLMVFLAGCDVPAPASLLPPPPFSSLPAPPIAQAGSCIANQLWHQGILRSTDHRATWNSVGEVCAPEIGGLLPADPTPLVVDGRIVLYFVDLAALDKGILYRFTSADGVNFDKPQPVYTHPSGLMDPFVLRMSDGSFRMYASAGADIISAKSSDGLKFTREDGVRWTGGGMVGALLLPDKRVRLFLDTGPSQQGIVSFISNDGLQFAPEPGLRIAKRNDYMTMNNAQPIRLADGTYLMLYQTQDQKHEGRPDWKAEIHLATSQDGLNWSANPKVLEYGGTSCVVEAPDGALYIYYGY